MSKVILIADETHAALKKFIEDSYQKTGYKIVMRTFIDKAVQEKIGLVPKKGEKKKDTKY